MKIYNIYSELDNKIGRESCVGSNENQNHDTYEIIPFVPKKFEPDVSKLKVYIGEANFIKGLTIETSLAEISDICPHKRVRTDSYDALVQFLHDELDINLIISNKRYGTAANNIGRE